MSLSRTTTFSSGDAEVDVITGAVRLKAVVIGLAVAATADSYLRIWNTAAPVPGTTEPHLVIYLPTYLKLGETRIKVSLGGLRFDTALAYGVYTTPHSGNTTAIAADAPLAVEIYYDVSS
jgi:hypothetical protein